MIMNAKFIGLTLLTIVIIGIAWKVSEDRAPQTEVIRATLYPGLINQLNDIGRVAVRSADQESILLRDGDAWKLENRDGYPAAFTNVKRAILQIADLDIVEPKTSLPESYKKIGVADIESGGATGKLVELYNNGGEEILGLIIGNKSGGGADTQYYVRKRGDPQSWLVSGALDIASAPLEWVDTAIANIDTGRVRQVTITPTDGDPIIISKENAKKNFFELANVPDGFKVKSKSTVSSIGAILLNLEFKDVAAASVLAKLQPRKTLNLQTFDGLVSNLKEFDYDGKVLVRFNFSYDPDIVVHDENEIGAAPSGETAAVESKEETIEAEIARLNRRTALWAYELPAYKIRTINHQFEDLIDKDEPEGEVEEE
jgi:hypothetical protein